MAMNNYEWQSGSVIKGRSAVVHNMSETLDLSAQLDSFTKRMNNYMTYRPPQYNQAVSSHDYYEDCGGDYYFEDYPSVVEPVEYFGNVGRNDVNLHLNAYNSGWGNHQELCWDDNSIESFSTPVQMPTQLHGFSAPQRPHYQQIYFDIPPPQEQKPSLEDVLNRFINNGQAIVQSLVVSRKGLEDQMGQLTNGVGISDHLEFTYSDSEPNLRGEGTEQHEMTELIIEDEIDENLKTDELEKEEEEQTDQSKIEELMPMFKEALVSTPHIEHHNFVFKVAGEPKFEQFYELVKLLNQALAKTSTYKEQINSWQHARRLQPFWEATTNPPRLSLFIYEPP